MSKLFSIKVKCIERENIEKSVRQKDEGSPLLLSLFNYPVLTRFIHDPVHPDGKHQQSIESNSPDFINQPITILENEVWYPCNRPDWWRILTSHAVNGSNK